MNQSFQQIQRRVVMQTMLPLACLFWFGPLYAASISLMPATTIVRLGDPVTLDLLMNFSDVPTLGGGMDISFNNNIIKSPSFVFDTPLDLDPSFTGWESLSAGVVTIYFGNFAGLHGPAKVGALSFFATGVGTTNLSLQDSTKWGSFFSAQSSQPISTQYNGASVQVVPLPAGIWMLLAGMAPLAGYLWRASTFRKQ